MTKAKKSTTQLKLLDENNLSKAAEKKIEIANRTWGHARDTIIDVYKQLLDDGWDDQKAGKICLKRCNAFFSATTIRSILPPEAKNPNMIRHKKTPELEQTQKPEIATNSLQNTDVYTPEEHQQPEPETVPMLDSGQQEASEPMVNTNQNESTLEPQTDSQKLAKKYQKPPKEKITDISITKEEQSVQEFGIMMDEDGFEQIDTKKLPIPLKTLEKFSHSYLARLVYVALGQMDDLLAENENLEEENCRVSERIRELQGDETGRDEYPMPEEKLRRPRKYASYEQTKQFAMSHGIKSRDQWRKYIREHKDEFPTNIPTRPDATFRGKEWVNWKTFFA